MTIVLRRLVLGTVVVTSTVFVVWSYRDLYLQNRAGTAYKETPFDWVLETSFFAGAVLAVLAGALLWDRQPGNRCGVALIVLGVSMGVFYRFAMLTEGAVPPDSRYEHVLLLAGVALLRPMLIWVLLAWPTGRLRRWEAVLVAVYGAGHVLTVFATQMMYRDGAVGVVSLEWLGEPLWATQFFVVTLGVEILVVVVVVRRVRDAAPQARPLILPVVVASVLVLVGDIAVPLNSSLLPTWTREADGGGLTAFGFAAIGLDYLRYVAVPLILLFAAVQRRGWRGAPLTVELGAVTSPRSLSSLFAESLGDPTARVLYPSAADWVDEAGASVEPPSGGRVLTLVERDAEVVAAIDHGAVVRPAALEAAAGTLVLLVEHRALEARTQGRVRELRRLRSTVLEAEDAMRRRLERDLHDGAQQQILALALQARMSAAVKPDRLAVEIDRVRSELLDIADGVTERVVAERGLASFLQVLAAMSPVAVALSSEVPDPLGPTVAAAAWFVASEAVGNAAKHAAAVHVNVDVRPIGDTLIVAVSDDGRGGADPEGGGLRGLAQRVREVGGELSIRSPRGAGTSLVASLPLGAA